MTRRRDPHIELSMTVKEAVMLGQLLQIVYQAGENGERLSPELRHFIEDQAGRLKLQLDMLYFRNLKKAPYPI